MNKLATLNRNTTPSPSEPAVLAACQEAKRLGGEYAVACLIAGQLLTEFRESMGRVSHREKPSINGRNQHSNGDGFTKWVVKQGISVPTAYRWMEVAERVARLQLNVPMAFPMQNVIEVKAESGEESPQSKAPRQIPLSVALTAPEKSLPSEALKFRQGIFEFMADKTLSEALTAAVDGESDPHRITRAAGGKTKGGTRGEDRKEFDKFTKTKLQHLTTFFHQKISTGQKGEIITAFNRALEAWPRWVLEGIAEKCKSELKLTEQERNSRTEF